MLATAVPQKGQLSCVQLLAGAWKKAVSTIPWEKALLEGVQQDFICAQQSEGSLPVSGACARRGVYCPNGKPQLQDKLVWLHSSRLVCMGRRQAFLLPL